MAATHKFDVIVIGAGQSGPSLLERFAKQGKRVAIVERKFFGGTCVNTGCIPTKTLVASAYVAHMARRAAEYGVDVGGAVKVDMARVKARKDDIFMKSRNGVTRWMEKTASVFRGHARFTSPKTLSVNGDTLEAENIVINTGGRAAVPPITGLDQVTYFTNSSMLEVDFLPEHLLIVGGSYIGLEFAQIYRRFGARVTVVEMSDRLIAREDPEVSDTVRTILEAEGIEVRLNAKCLSLAKDGNGIAMSVDCTSGAPTIRGSHALIATGRRPNTDDLGLDRAGVATDARGYITVDDQCRTNVPGIWAIGDVNGRGAFTHTSYNDYEIVAANIFDNDPRRLSDRIPAYALYTDPPLGRVGMTDKEIRAKGIKALAARREMQNVGRAYERSETLGFMKVTVDAATKKILGAAILGLNGDEVIHCFIDVMAAGAPYTAISRAMHIHPTVSEYLPTLLGDLQPMQ
jgi:pyruvate/2-oxoglutarate dehydrogenase complex dihydrolipoamide dehydrogenase (E3) component